MRINEVLLEDYARNLKVDLDTILAASVGRGHSEIDTARLTDLLNRMGYSVTPENLEALASESPLVVSVSGDTVTLKSDQPEARNPEPVDTEAEVEKMAMDASAKSKGI